jgi:N-acetylmuramoyl-L-alanine amidase
VTLSLLLLLLLAAWPAPTKLTPPALPALAPHAKRLKVVIDAGHGAPGNDGNHGCACQLESAFTLSAAHRLAEALRTTGRFEVLETRVGDARPTYQARIAQAVAFAPDAIVSLHSDARGTPEYFARDAGACRTRTDSPGVTVLWSGEGSAATVAARARLGRALSRRLGETGFPRYDGRDYAGLYTTDPEVPGCFVDARPEGKRVYFLRATEVPTVIIETHHALDPEEVARWAEPSTHEAFARAVAAGLLDPGIDGP